MSFLDFILTINRSAVNRLLLLLLFGNGCLRLLGSFQCTVKNLCSHVLSEQMLQMFYITIWGKAAEDWSSDEVLSNLYALSDSPVLLSELLELLRYRYEKIDFIDEPVDLGFDCPLDLHCTYTRDQLLVALDFLKPSTVREGVKWLPEK